MPADLPAREGKRLSSARHRQREVIEPRQRRRPHVLALIEDQVLVHLVAEQHRAGLPSELTDALELGPGEQLPRRVVGGVEDHQLRLRRERSRELSVVEPPLRVGRIRRSQPDEARRCMRHLDRGQIRIVERLEEHHLVARVGQGHHRVEDRLGRAGSDADLGDRVHHLPVEAPGVRGDGSAEHRRPLPDRVLIDAAVDRVDRGLGDLPGTIEVGEALPEVDRSVLQRESREFAED